MAKDPAVLFYTSDFLVGVSDMPFLDRGYYITLLCMQHQKGHLSEETICFALGLRSVSEISRVMSHFRIDEHGLYYQNRMDIETEKRCKFTESRRLNGGKGGRPQNLVDNHKDKHMPNHMDTHMENENRDINNSSKSFIKPTVEEVNSYCIERKNNIDGQSFIDFYDSKGWMIGKNHMKNWQAAVRTWEKHNKGGSQNGVSGDHAKSQGTSRWGNLGGIEL